MKFLNRRKKSPTPDPQNTRNFLDALKTAATPAGRGDYAFSAPDGSRIGYAQFIPESPTQIIIHRLWTQTPGQGNGSALLKQICALADTHAVELVLQTIPIGRKPHPMTQTQLAAWYARHGFVPTGKTMTRSPVTQTSNPAHPPN